MTRFRWGLGAAIAVLAMVAALQALTTYVAHRLWLGSATVLLLAAIDVVGFASLGGARRRLAREHALLAQSPPDGELWSTRRAALEGIQRAGHRADLDVLAQTTAAEETGRAYLGRYLVAVTVLVGLVGTFAGLMETLRAVAPLVGDEHRSALELIAAPLAGLDVTFGASIVGILVTLALALVQGDLTLAEEQVLSRLEERTRHVLFPSLWPASDAPDERAARELSALRHELRDFLTATVAATSTKVAEIAATETRRLTTDVAGALERAVTEATGRLDRGLLELARQVEQQLTARASQEERRQQALHDEVRALGRSATETLGAGSAALLDELARARSSLAAAQTELLAAARAELERVAAVTAGAVDRTESALRAGAERVAEESSRRAATDAAADALREQSLGRLVEQQAAGIARVLEMAAAGDEERHRALHALLEVHAEEVRRLHVAGAAADDERHEAARRLAEAQASASTRLHQAAVDADARRQEALAALATGHAAELARLFEEVARSDAQRKQTLDALAEKHAAEMTRSLTSLEQAGERHQAALASVVASHAAELRATGGAVQQAIAGAMGDARAQLDDATSALAKAARDLHGGAVALRPSVDALAPELAALAREVALLAARAEAGEQTVVLDELSRLGEGVDRLDALLRLAQDGRAAAEEA